MADILVVEDDLNLRNQLEKFLETKNHTVVTAQDGWEALNVLEMGVDILILDLRMPNLSGLGFLKKLAEIHPVRPPIILVTGHAEKANLIEAIQAGVFHCLEKPFSPQELDSTIQRALIERKQDIQTFRLKLLKTDSSLTSREQEVADLVALGLTNDEIAKKLGLGIETVKSHLKKLFRKLQVQNRVELATAVNQKRAGNQSG